MQRVSPRCTHCRRSSLLITCTVLSLMLFGACSMRMNWPEHTIDVSIHVPTRTAWPDRAHHHEATQVLLTVDSIELMPCEAEQRTGYAQSLLDQLVPSAQAHGVSTETKLANHYIINLVGQKTRTSYGQWTPPPARYCAIELLIASADDDAFGAEEHPQMEGKSLSIATHEMNPSSTAMTRRWHTTRKISRRIELDTPIELNGDGESQKRTIDLSLSLEQPMPSIDPQHELDQGWLSAFQQALSVRLMP